MCVCVCGRGGGASGSDKYFVMNMICSSNIKAEFLPSSYRCGGRGPTNKGTANK